MNVALRELVERGGGLVTRAAAGQVVPSWTLEQACRGGHLVRVLPEVFVAAHLVDGRPGAPALSRLDPALGQRAALAWADGCGALSHLSALSAWGLHQQAVADPVHLSVPADAGLRTRPGVIVHRRRGLAIEPPHVVLRRGLTVIRLEQALVDSWPTLPPSGRRAPVIRAVNDRLTTPERLAAALGSAPKLIDRAALRTLLTRLADGCRSPLEIWGHEHVFTGPGMPAFRRQVPVRVGRRTMYLDMLAEPEQVNIELDGATTHGDPRQREIDLRRDALLATIGILVVRYAHRRLVHDIDAVRRETLAILATRRAGATA
ncbi:endonuclease domain-containing protein [Micromonospora sp. ZYX-F-536]|uniref:endonuclease domain-containing protein n=1 Tax=Micromonospora sp. ZYX-F-536 TaxID=3457629 RepID=UPI004040AA92